MRFIHSRRRTFCGHDSISFPKNDSLQKFKSDLELLPTVIMVTPNRMLEFGGVAQQDHPDLAGNIVATKKMILLR